MPIVSNTLLSSTPNGSRVDVHYEFVDQLGGKHRYSKLVPAGLDTNADMLSMYASLDEGLVEAEIAEQLNAVEDGIDVLPAVLSPNHATSKQIFMALIRFMMREKNPYIVLALEPTILYLRATYTTAQLKNALTFTTNQVIKLNSRINAVLNNKADFVTYDSNSEDIE